MSGLRAAVPRTLIFVKPTFINPNNGASYPTLLNSAKANSISMASEDVTKEASFAANDWAQAAYLGLWPGFTTVDHTKANGGNPDWDFHCNVDSAELWNNGNTNAVIPPASKGSGYMYDVGATGGIWTKVKQMKASHIDIYLDASGGPNINRRTFSAAAPPNPPLGPGPGLVAAHPNIVDMLTENTAYPGIVAGALAIPWITYPFGYP
jgi:hypothetical protein